MAIKDLEIKEEEVQLDEAEMLDLIARYNQAWTNCDVELIKSIFHPEGSYSDGLWAQTCFHSEFDSYFPLAFEESREEEFEMLDTIFSKPAKAVRIYTAWTRDESNNRVERIRGCEFFNFRNGLIYTVLDQYFPVSLSLIDEYAQNNVGFRSFQKYAKSGLREIEMGRLHSALIFLLEEEKIYLSPRVSAQILATRVNCSVNHLSQVVNTRFNMNLNSLLNKYRVEHACSLLESSAGTETQVKTIARESGFSSMSGFFKVFKSLTGHSPKSYHLKYSTQA